MLNRRQFALGAASLGASATIGLPAVAQAQGGFPTRPLRIVVGFSAGTPADVVIRVVADRLGARLGQPVTVDNRPGAGGVIATDHVLRQPADGYTMVMLAPSTVSARFVLAKVPYQFPGDFSLIAPFTQLPMALLSSAKEPVATPKEWLALVKAHPGKYEFGSYGQAATNNLSMQVLMKGLGIDMVHVPYKDASQMYTDMIRGEIQFMLDSPGAQLPGIRAGQVRILAVGSDKRYPGLPDTPTVSESLLPGFTYTSWFGLAAPAGLPPAVAERIAREVSAIVQDPVVAKRMEDVYFAPALGNGATLLRMAQQVEGDYTDALRNGVIAKPV